MRRALHLKKRIGGCFLLTALLVTLTACGKQSGRAPDEPAKTTVTLWYYWDIPTNQNHLAGLIDEFNAAQKRIVVESRYVPDEDFKKQLALSMAEGNMPDIALVDSSDFRFYQNMKPFVELSGKIKELDAYLPSALKPCTVGNRIYGLPFGVNCPALFYNKDILNEAGCEPPVTWEEFCDTAVRTTSEAHYGFTIPALQSEESLYTFLPILWSNGGSITTIDGAGGRRAFGILRTLAQAGALDRQSVSQTMGDQTNQFIKGKTAMMFNTGMCIDYIRQVNPELSFGVTYLPTDGDRLSVAGGEIFAVSQGGHEAEAIEFLRFMANPDRMRSYMDDFGFLAPRQDIMEEQYPQEPDKQIFIEIYQTARFRQFTSWWPSMSEEVTNAMAQIILGMDPDAVLTEAAEEINTIRAKAAGFYSSQRDKDTAGETGEAGGSL